MRDVVEDYCCLDINRESKCHRLRDGYRGTLDWSNGSSINAKYCHSQFYIQYFVDDLKVEQSLSVESRICHFGGSRFYWRCPSCNVRRCQLLMSLYNGFHCRACLGVPYRIQQLGAIDSAINQRNKMETALTGSMSTVRRLRLYFRLTKIYSKISLEMEKFDASLGS